MLKSQMTLEWSDNWNRKPAKFLFIWINGLFRKKKNQFDNPTKAKDMNVTIYQIFEDDIKGFTVSGASPLAGGDEVGRPAVPSPIIL